MDSADIVEVQDLAVIQHLVALAAQVDSADILA